jgi:hypothetical protein
VAQLAAAREKVLELERALEDAQAELAATRDANVAAHLRESTLGEQLRVASERAEKLGSRSEMLAQVEELRGALQDEVARGTALTNRLVAADKVHRAVLASCRRVSREKALLQARIDELEAANAALTVSREEALRPYTPRPDWGRLYVEFADVDAAATLAVQAPPPALPRLVPADEPLALSSEAAVATAATAAAAAAAAAASEVTSGAQSPRARATPRAGAGHGHGYAGPGLMDTVRVAEASLAAVAASAAAAAAVGSAVPLTDDVAASVHAEACDDNGSPASVNDSFVSTSSGASPLSPSPDAISFALYQDTPRPTAAGLSATAVSASKTPRSPFAVRAGPVTVSSSSSSSSSGSGGSCASVSALPPSSAAVQQSLAQGSLHHVRALFSALRTSSAHARSLTEQLVLSVDVQRATKAASAALRSELQALKAGSHAGAGPAAPAAGKGAAGKSTDGDGTAPTPASSAAPTGTYAPVLGVHVPLPAAHRLEITVRLPGANRWMLGLGQGTRDSPVPEFLRIVGRVRHKAMPRRDCEALIYDVWRAKMLHDARRGYLDLPFAEYFGVHLRGRFGLPSIVADYGYNMLDAAHRHQAHSDCDLFLRVLTGQLHEETYYDQAALLHQLHLLFVNLDLVRQQVAAPLPDSSVFVQESALDAGAALGLRSSGGSGSSGSALPSPTSTALGPAAASAPGSTSGAKPDSDEAAEGTASAAVAGSSPSATSTAASSSSSTLLPEIPNADRRLPRALLIYALKLFFPQKTDGQFEALVRSLDATLAALPAAASDYALLLHETRGNCETEFVSQVRAQHSHEITSFPLKLKEEVMVYARRVDAPAIGASSTSALASTGSNAIAGVGASVSGGIAVVRVHDIRDRWMRLDPLAPLSRITALIARTLNCAPELLDGGRLVGVDAFFRALANVCFFVPTLNYDPSAVERVAGWLKAICAGAGLSHMSGASAGAAAGAGTVGSFGAGAGAAAAPAPSNAGGASVAAAAVVGAAGGLSSSAYAVTASTIDRALRGPNSTAAPAAGAATTPASADAAAAVGSGAISVGSGVSGASSAAPGGSTAPGYNRRRSHRGSYDAASVSVAGPGTGAGVGAGAVSASAFGVSVGGQLPLLGLSSMLVTGVPDLVLTHAELIIFDTPGIFGAALGDVAPAQQQQQQQKAEEAAAATTAAIAAAGANGGSVRPARVDLNVTTAVTAPAAASGSGAGPVVAALGGAAGSSGGGGASAAASAAAAARRAKLLQQAQSRFSLQVARTRARFGLPRSPKDEIPVIVLPRGPEYGVPVAITLAQGPTVAADADGLAPTGTMAASGAAAAGAGLAGAGTGEGAGKGGEKTPGPKKSRLSTTVAAASGVGATPSRPARLSVGLGGNKTAPTPPKSVPRTPAGAASPNSHAAAAALTAAAPASQPTSAATATAAASRAAVAIPEEADGADDDGPEDAGPGHAADAELEGGGLGAGLDLEWGDKAGEA